MFYLIYFYCIFLLEPSNPAASLLSPFGALLFSEMFCKLNINLNVTGHLQFNGLINVAIRNSKLLSCELNMMRFIFSLIPLKVQTW